MTLKADLDTAVATLAAELDSINFLSPGARSGVDQSLIDEIQADLDYLESTYNASFTTAWLGTPHTPTALEIAHWLFDQLPPEEHRLTIVVHTTSPDEKLSYTIDVPR